jgi:hypothetical protein
VHCGLLRSPSFRFSQVTSSSFPLLRLLRLLAFFADYPFPILPLTSTRFPLTPIALPVIMISMFGVIQAESASIETCRPKPWRRRIRGKFYFWTKPDKTPPSPLSRSLIHNHLRFISGRRRPVLLSHLPEELRGPRRSYEDQKSVNRLKPSFSSASLCVLLFKTIPFGAPNCKCGHLHQVASTCTNLRKKKLRKSYYLHERDAWPVSL